MNRLIITNNFEKLIEEISTTKVYYKDELKVDDVRDIKKEAYISERDKKIILIAAEKYNIYAQNALLKILEESPKNVEFILLAKSKYNLLDTILSRLVVERKFFEEKKEKIEIENITNSFIFDTLKDDIDKQKAILILKSLLKKAKNDKELKILNDALMMIELNIDIKSVLAMVFLAFKER